jgi:tripartite-type tricarboxylate transporter receptor subunit TctC
MKSPSLHWAFAFAALLTPLAAQAQAQYPSQAIKLIVPYAAGGFPDTTARIVGAKLQDKIGQSVVVENRPGGAGSVAVSALSQAAPDGYTVMATDGSTFTVNPALFKSLSYSPKDVMPVALIARTPLFLTVNASVPVNTFKEFVDYVKAHPNELNYGSSGVGSAHHLSMEALKAALGLQMTHIPYRGTGQSVPALLGGHVQVLFSAYPSLAGAIADKRVKLLATNGAQPSPQAPDVPPIGSVIPGYDLASMVGLFVRTGTPPPIIKKLADEAVAVVKMPETRKQMEGAGIEPAGEGTDAFAKYLAAEAGHVGKVIETAGIKVE